MRILCVGGGSGGHVTPIVAVIREIKRQKSGAEIRFITDNKFLAQSKVILASENIPVSTVVSGKMRRYVGAVWYWKIRHWLTNFVDLFKVGIGFFQSIGKLIAWRPDVVFVKGGYVGLPVGVAARVLGVPLVIHDSDAHPGLTDRLLSRHAVKIATGMPTKYYQYPKSKTEFVGIPVRQEFYDAVKAKKPRGGKLIDVLVIGGGLGARRLNDEILENANELRGVANVTLVTGEANYREIKDRAAKAKHIKAVAFVGEDLAIMEHQADIIVTRAGATTLAELSLLGSTVILVPNPHLASDHQTKNATIYGDAGAAIVITQAELDDNKTLLTDTIKKLTNDRPLQRSLGKNLAKFSMPDAAERMAKMIIGVAGNVRKE